MSVAELSKSRACGDSIARTIEIFEVSSPIGTLNLRLCSRGLHSLCQSPDINDGNFAPNDSVEVKLLSGLPNDSSHRQLVCETLNWLNIYFHNLPNIQQQTLPQFCCIGECGAFRDKVLMMLAKNVPPGHVMSYAELAILAGSKGAQQSVGTAMAKNPFQLMVPCHRVVKSGNRIGLYAGGCRNSVKVWLLQHEGLLIADNGKVHMQ